MSTQVNQWIKHATALLEASQVPSARLDVLILLEDVLDKDKAYLLAHPETELDERTVRMLEKQLVRRGAHEPLAYIRGKSEFYGREFKVTAATLQPRPETETMIDMLKNILENNYEFARIQPLQEVKNVVMVDVGTGSGCLAVTAKLEFPDASVYATEINNDALAVAEKNARNLGASIEFYQGNLLEPLVALSPQPFTLLCNLPYVPSNHTINQAAMQEPAIAIFGGEDGLDLYRELFDQIAKLVQKPILILTESLPFQHQSLATIAGASDYKLSMTVDFIQVFELS